MAFSEELINKVWDKAKIDPNNNPDVFRKDYAGAWIRKSDYGKQEKYGWQIDHLMPESMGGTNDLGNLLPLHWQNNEQKSDNYPRWSTKITSNGVENIEQIKNWFVQ